MKRRLARGVALGVASGLAAGVVAELFRPRGGEPSRLLDLEQVLDRAHGRIPGPPTPARRLAAAAERYQGLAAGVREPLLAAVGGLPAGVRLPPLEAVDRHGWLDLNAGLVRRAIEPLGARALLSDSLAARFGRAGANRYAALLMAFLSARVLGQYDPRLLAPEPEPEPALYLVEPNVAAWEAEAEVDGDDLRRWLILHEMTHAWQFAAHPWLREHLDSTLSGLLAELAGERGRGAGRLVQALGSGRPWRTLRSLQATMSLIEGYSNLLTSIVGRRLLPGHEALEAAYRHRSGRRSPTEVIFWKLTGLDLKLRQYRQGEAFCQDVHDLYGMEALNQAWASPTTLPRPEELNHPDRWHHRITQVHTQ